MSDQLTIENAKDKFIIAVGGVLITLGGMCVWQLHQININLAVIKTVSAQQTYRIDQHRDAIKELREQVSENTGEIKVIKSKIKL